MIVGHFSKNKKYSGGIFTKNGIKIFCKPIVAFTTFVLPVP
jgi:hypothetical protein